MRVTTRGRRPVRGTRPVPALGPALALALGTALVAGCSDPGAAAPTGPGTTASSAASTVPSSAPSSASPAPNPTTAPARRGPVDQSLPGPVLLVPGYGGNVADLDALRDLLVSRGRTAVEVRVPDGGTGDLRDEARAVRDAADAALAAGAPSVDVVGYSAGGVIARVYVAELGGAAVVRRVVTIGSPHHGTTLAARAIQAGLDCPAACRQLVPGSALLRSLPEPPVRARAAGPRFTSLWSSADEVIAPPSSSVLAGALSVRLQDVCADDASTHTRLPRTPLVGGLVLRALAVAPLTAVPAASECERLRTVG